MQGVQDKIVARLYGKGRGYAFSPKDMLDRGSRSSVDTALSTLVETGFIRRISRGLYDYPRSNPALGGILSPDIHQIAQALARKHSWNTQPAGAIAANLLGLSQQVPARALYLSDGPSKTVTFGRQRIQFKHASPKSTHVRHEMSALVLQALRHLGKDRIDEKTIARIRSSLKESDLRRLPQDLRYTADWIYETARQIVAAGDD